jgi:hypothetical protein
VIVITAYREAGLGVTFFFFGLSPQVEQGRARGEVKASACAIEVVKKKILGSHL